MFTMAKYITNLYRRLVGSNSRSEPGTSSEARTQTNQAVVIDEQQNDVEMLAAPPTPLVCVEEENQEVEVVDVHRLVVDIEDKEEEEQEQEDEEEEQEDEEEEEQENEEEEQEDDEEGEQDEEEEEQVMEEEELEVNEEEEEDQKEEEHESEEEEQQYSGNEEDEVMTIEDSDQEGETTAPSEEARGVIVLLVSYQLSPVLYSRPILAVPLAWGFGFGAIRIDTKFLSLVKLVYTVDIGYCRLTLKLF